MSQNKYKAFFAAWVNRLLFICVDQATTPEVKLDKLRLFLGILKSILGKPHRECAPGDLKNYPTSLLPCCTGCKGCIWVDDYCACISTCKQFAKFCVQKYGGKNKEDTHENAS